MLANGGSMVTVEAHVLANIRHLGDGGALLPASTQRGRRTAAGTLVIKGMDFAIRQACNIPTINLAPKGTVTTLRRTTVTTADDRGQPFEFHLWLAESSDFVDP